MKRLPQSRSPDPVPRARDPLQRAAVRAASRHGFAPVSPRFGLAEGPARPEQPNAGGLPARLKRSIEALSGWSLDDVRVHSNSSQPDRLGAFAFTRGSEIHLAPGQERYLPHEAWHVVQQKQGRVRPTLQRKGEGINDDPALEQEADLMGARAAQLGDAAAGPYSAQLAEGIRSGSVPAAAAIQLGNKQGTASKATSAEEKEAGQAEPPDLKARYDSKAPIRDAVLRVGIESGGEGLIEIVDLTRDKPWEGSFKGRIEYEAGASGEAELWLSSFESHPSGLGLGAMLLHQLALEALEQGCAQIRVLSPAISAMGAYMGFGARPKDRESFEATAGLMLQAIQENPEKHRKFVGDESKERADHALSRALFFDPAMSDNDQNFLYMSTVSDHVAAHSGPEDYRRQAEYLAASSQLYFTSETLRQLMETKLTERWTRLG